MKKILFYPITGNPPHLGHASAVLVALDHIAFDEVWIMPSGKRVDKVVPISDEDRMNLSSLFVEYLQSQTLVPIVHKSIGVDGTDDRFMHEHIIELKSEPNVEIFTLVGIDGFMSIKDRVIGPDERFVVIKRSGYEIPEGLVSNKNLIFLDEGVKGISSTKVREMVKNGDEGYTKLVPKEIAAYIAEKVFINEIVTVLETHRFEIRKATKIVLQDITEFGSRSRRQPKNRFATYAIIPSWRL